MSKFANDMSTSRKQLAIISGGTGYLGSAIVKVLQASGWNVASLSRRASASDVYECDVTSEADVQKVLSEIIEKYGRIDACIHAASAPMSTNRDLLSDTHESFDSHFATAVHGALFLARACVPHMTENSAFIGITSALIEPDTQPLPHMGSYVAAKCALRGFLRTLAVEVKQQGIRVFAVAPGFMAGGLNKGTPEKILHFLANKTNTGVTSPDEVIVVVKRICTEADSFPTGSSIAIPSGIVSPI